MHLVMLETNGNQRFIFSSPRLRENIGASYLLTQLQTWVAQAIRAEGLKDAVTRAYPAGTPDLPWVSRSSGKVILLADSEARARSVIGRVTRIALAQAPGIDVTGVFVEMTGSYVSREDLQRVHGESARYALRRPPAEARFSQMPFLLRARDSVLPASPPLGLPDEADRTEPYSLPSRIKRYRAHEARRELVGHALRRTDLWKDHPYGTPADAPDDAERRRKLERLLVVNPDALEDHFSEEGEESGSPGRAAKVAVVHVDGNGVGAIMRNIRAAMERVDARAFAETVSCPKGDDDALRRFLLAVNDRLEKAMAEAFYGAWADVARWSAREDDRRGRSDYRVVPVVPVILGGDDATVITDGMYAIPFSTAFLTRFESVTARDGLLRYLGDDGRMTAGAGIAVVRRSFPFHIAYDLAEELVGRAKKLGKGATPPLSTLTYHALFDSALLDVDELLQSYASFTTRPYTLGLGGTPEPEGHPSWDWMCRLTALSTGLFKVVPEEGTAPDQWPLVRAPGGRGEPFPKTRAARIRKLMSDAANAAEEPTLYGNDGSWAPQARPTDETLTREAIPAAGFAQKIVSEWNSVLTSADKDLAALARALGDPRVFFDLLELADLLPDSYLIDRLAAHHATEEQDS